MTSESTLSRRLSLLLATSVGVLAANLYYTQPLAVPIATSLGLDVAKAGLVVTLTQAGYVVGVLLLVPLGDLLENRKVILFLISMTFLSLLGVGMSHRLALYGATAFLLGVGASCIQVIVPYATHLAPSEIRGQVVGRMMSGIMFGIMLSRPLGGFLSAAFSWHAVFYFSAAMLLVIGTLLHLQLPRRRPNATHLRYGDVLASMGKLHFQYSLLRRRAIYQACMFASYCLFWTAAPILLASPTFRFSQSAIAIFAFVGVTGALFAPIAGRLADRGWTSPMTAMAFAFGAAAFLLTHFAALGSTLSLVLLVIGACLLDAGVSGNLVLGQRAIFGLSSELRARLNSLYVATIFVGGAFGSFAGAWAYARGGWEAASWVGFALPAAGLIYFLTEFYFRRTRLPAI